MLATHLSIANEVLENSFGFEKFRIGQDMLVESVLSGRDVLIDEVED